MRALTLFLLVFSMPLHAQTAHERRLDALVDAATAILVAEASRAPIRPLWCVTPTAPDRRVRVRVWAPSAQWLWCFPADLPPGWMGPWR